MARSARISQQSQFNTSSGDPLHGIFPKKWPWTRGFLLYGGLGLTVDPPFPLSGGAPRFFGG
eukprot:scaffold2600_cov103-Isochrysis_galbana.AAC.7